MHIVIFTNELPFPATHGGRKDVWNRIRTLKSLGHKVFLVAWAIHNDNSKVESIVETKTVVDHLECYVRNNNWWARLYNISKKFSMILKQPNIVTDCTLRHNDFTLLAKKIESFKADCIWSEGVYAGKIALKYAEFFRIPFFVRSHNIEHKYIKQLISDSKSLTIRMKFWGMSWNLKNYEMHILKSSNAFFDISITDLQFWKSQGLTQGYWMPPIFIPDDIVNRYQNLPKGSFDISYIGNLYSPNNVRAIKWFLTAVLPKVKAEIPDVSILIAGFKPVKSLKQFCTSLSNVTLIDSPETLEILYDKSTILINPILSGSGINIKTIEMLHHNKQIVCTSLAVKGLPDKFREIVKVADTGDLFAKSLIEILRFDIKSTNFTLRDELKEYFSTSYFKSNIDIMNSFISPSLPKTEKLHSTGN